MKEFIVDYQDGRVPRIATMAFFCEDNGFSVDDIYAVASLKMGETIIVGMDKAMIIRVFNRVK